MIEIKSIDYCPPEVAIARGSVSCELLVQLAQAEMQKVLDRIEQGQYPTASGALENTPLELKFRGVKNGRLVFGVIAYPKVINIHVRA